MELARALAAERLVWHSGPACPVTRVHGVVRRRHFLLDIPVIASMPVSLPNLQGIAQGIAMNRPHLARPNLHNRLRSVALAVAFTWLAASLAQAAEPPKPGSLAPDFKLQDQHGKWHELKDYRGKWVALYFYPKDKTPGCTTQACEFRDNIFAFRDANAVILGVSVDDVESHREFSEKHSLPFSILADDKKVVAREYGVLKRFLGTIELARRDTFLIDPEGRIVRHYEDVDPKGHSELVLKDIKALQKKSS
jgi:peroxiredoxin Q/BCP